MDIERKNLGKISESDRRALMQLRACKAACKEIVETVVFEWENATIQMNEFWRVIRERYAKDADHKKDSFEIDDDGTLTQIVNGVIAGRTARAETSTKALLKRMGVDK